MIDSGRLEYIKPADLHTYWTLIRPGLEYVKSVADDGWIPEDVYSALKANTATLHIGQDEAGEYLGFVVLSLVPHWDGQEMNVWVAYSAVTDKQPILMWQEQIWQMARKAGAKRIVFSSPRKGWEKVAPAIGFRPYTTVYKCEV